MSSQHMAAPGSLRGPEQPPTGPSPPPTQNSIHSLRKEPISTLHSPLHSRGNHISLGEPEAALHSPAWPAATRHRCGRAGLQLLFSPQNKAPHPADPALNLSLRAAPRHLRFTPCRSARGERVILREGAGREGTSLACFLQLHPGSQAPGFA